MKGRYVHKLVLTGERRKTLTEGSDPKGKRGGTAVRALQRKKPATEEEETCGVRGRGAHHEGSSGKPQRPRVKEGPREVGKKKQKACTTLGPDALELKRTEGQRSTCNSQ